VKKKKKIFWNKRSGKMISSSEVKTRRAEGDKPETPSGTEEESADRVERQKSFVKNLSKEIKKAARDGKNI